jgi:glycogen debranching enzyme
MPRSGSSRRLAPTSPTPAILEFVRSELYPVFADIISWHVRGTRYGIKVDPSGLLTSGEPGVQLTWMDAKVGDWVVTPRRGKPVEIQALWYNALCIMEGLARRFGDEPGQKRYRNMATVASWSFNRLFWNENTGCLYDVTTARRRTRPSAPTRSLRSACHTACCRRNARRAWSRKFKSICSRRTVCAVWRPAIRNIVDAITGGPVERDGAYHQGTVWPWLIGPFITAYVKVNGGSDAARRQAVRMARCL